MHTTLDADTLSGAQRPLEEQIAAVNRHADAPTLTDQVSDIAAASSAAGQALQNAVAASDEWLDAGRTVVRAHPLLAIGGAALIGLALSLATSRAVRR